MDPIDSTLIFLEGLWASSWQDLGINLSHKELTSKQYIQYMKFLVFTHEEMSHPNGLE